MMLKATFNPQQVSVAAKGDSLLASTGNPVAREYVDLPPYDGPYEATPTQETQVFSTQNKRMTENFTVNPIPSNYGLVTWNGSVLTVS